MKPTEADVGIIIGRFQVPTLHDAHKELIDLVRNTHRRLIIFLGCAPRASTQKDPLTFESRMAMIKGHAPVAEVYPLPDTEDDPSWIRNLDALIERLLLPWQTCVLYGGRESFLDVYRGKYPTRELLSTTTISGEQIRREVACQPQNSGAFRAGMVAAAYSRYPLSQQTVDVAVISATQNLLLIRKPGESVWRFPGGFVPAGAQSLEQHAAIELYEETGLVVHPAMLRYVTSRRINDWRYRTGPDTLLTALFTITIPEVDPQVQGGDDAEHAEWVPRKTALTNMHQNHQDLLTILLSHA